MKFTEEDGPPLHPMSSIYWKEDEFADVFDHEMDSQCLSHLFQTQSWKGLVGWCSKSI